MLVLTRKADEVILVGKEIKITVVRISPHQVRLGIDAPKDINIVRKELIIKQSEKKEESNYA